MENMTDRLSVQKALAAAHFAVLEANLFLDTHPDCTLALEYFYDRQDEYATCSQHMLTVLVPYPQATTA